MNKASSGKKRANASSVVVENGMVLNTEHPDVITLQRARVIDGYQVRMTFSNNEIRELDLKPYLRGPIFKPLRDDYQLFRRLYVHPETETLTWQNGADMDPQTLYEDSIAVPRPAIRSSSKLSRTKKKGLEQILPKGQRNQRPRKQTSRSVMHAKQK
jgi:hypothetical protein